VGILIVLAAFPRTSQAPAPERQADEPAWVVQAADPHSCKPRPPFSLEGSVDHAGNWVLRATNPGLPRDVVLSTWSDVDPVPAVVWAGRLDADETRTIPAGPLPAAANRLWAAMELQPSDPNTGAGAGDTAGGPPIWRSVALLERPGLAGAAAAQPEPHVDPSTGELVLDLPGTLGTEP
jgi:hypothetical protein